MAHRQDSHKSLFSFRNPFRMILRKGSTLSPEMLDLSKSFEENLAGRLRKLKPASTEDVLCLSWMRNAVDSVCELHADLKKLITTLELPVCDWDEKWIDIYLCNTAKLMDIYVAFSSEISRLKQGHLFLQRALHDLSSASASSTRFLKARSSLDEWRRHIGSNSPRLAKVFSVTDNLAKALELPKVKKSSKGKILMLAMYGCMAVNLLICSTFAAAFSGSARNLVDLEVPQTFSWSEAFVDLQAFVNTELRSMHSNGNVAFLKELEAAETAVKNLYPIVQDGIDNPVEAEALQSFMLDLTSSDESLSEGLDALAKEVDGLLKVVVRGRDALLSNNRLAGNGSNQAPGNHNA